MHDRKLISRLVSRKYALAIPTIMILTLLMGHLSTLSLGEGKSRLQILIMGGGTSHDFAQNYQEIDAQALSSSGNSVRYVDSWPQLAEGLKKTQVLIQASNQIPPPELAIRSAIMNFVDAGGGLLVVHAGLWYNWPDWPDYNRVLVGGGSRSHDELGDFEVTVTHPEHPMMKGVPAKFMVHDELYHQEIDPSGSPVEVLAIASSPVTGKTYPSVWVVKGTRRIACIALGHDQGSHNNPAYARLVVNASNWLSQR